MKHRIVISAFLALALGAGAADWFDAGISDYAQWPSDGSDFLVPGAGTWTGTSNATLVRTNGLSRLSVTPRSEGDALAFGTEVAKDMSDNLLFRVTATFCLFCELPNADPSFKTALTALEKKNGQVVYCGFVADGDNGTNCWAELSGATPRDGEEVELEVYMRTTVDGSEVRYVVDGTPLARNGSEWLPIVVADGSTSISEVGYSGRGELAALSAEADGTAAPTVLTIPAIAGMELVSVKVGETDIAVSNGVYVVDSGARVVVTFQPTAGRVLNTTTMSFRAAGETMELPAEGRPVSVLASDVLRVNEVMASNETVLNTAGGVPALDWVEIPQHGRLRHRHHRLADHGRPREGAREVEAGRRSRRRARARLPRGVSGFLILGLGSARRPCAARPFRERRGDRPRDARRDGRLPVHLRTADGRRVVRVRAPRQDAAEPLFPR